MYEWVKQSGTGEESVPLSVELLFFVLYLVLALGVVGRVLDSLLGLGFFHGFLGLFGALGANRSALLALFLLQFLAAQQLDKGSVCAVAFPPPGANNAQITALTIPETRRHNVEKPGHRLLGHQVSAGLAARGKISALAERDHLLHQRPQGLGLGHGGLDT